MRRLARRSRRPAAVAGAASAVAAAQVAPSQGAIDRFIDALSQIEGGYAFVGMTNKKLVGARDQLGIRPLVLGRLDGHPILASETCALAML